VVACNTATSAAIETLRAELTIPVIGMEPAVKPAVTKYGAEKVFVMATPATLRLRKFNDLMSFFSESAQILPIPCPGLMEIIERAVVSGPEIDAYLEQVFDGRKPGRGDVVVLGCTHYVFLKRYLGAYFGEGVEVIDGNTGTVNQLIHRLRENDSLCGSREKGEVNTYTSGDESLFMPVFQRLLTL